MSGSLEAKIVRIDFEIGETGRIYASSQDVQGLLLGRRSIEELEAALPGAIEELYLACGVAVVVSKVSKTGSDAPSWVAFPAEIAKRALAPA